MSALLKNLRPVPRTWDGVDGARGSGIAIVRYRAPLWVRITRFFIWRA